MMELHFFFVIKYIACTLSVSSVGKRIMYDLNKVFTHREKYHTRSTRTKRFGINNNNNHERIKKTRLMT